MSKVIDELDEAGLLKYILWEEDFDEPRPGYFDQLRASLEDKDEEQLLDMWLRGHSIIGYSPSVLHAVDSIRKALAKENPKQ